MSESGPKFYKSSFCDTGSCAEVAMEPDEVLFRNNSIEPDNILSFEPGRWNRFMKDLREEHQHQAKS